MLLRIFPGIWCLCDGINPGLRKNSISLTTGCFKKNFTLGISIISPAINMLEGWDISHLKGEIHSSVWSTKTFLNDIRELRYKQNNMEYKISNNEQYYILKSDTAAIYE